MNNKNKILVGCLALLLVLSVGYALFSDTITINGTATAKGSFDMVATCPETVPEKIENILLEEGLNTTQGGYQNDSCSVSDDIVSTSVDLLYPTAVKSFTVEITNNGSISSIVDITEQNSGETSNKMCLTDKETNEVTCGSTNTSNYVWYLVIPLGLKDTDGNLVLGNEDAITNFMDENGNFIINPGESVYYALTYVWPDATNVLQQQMYDENYLSYEMSYDINFNQVAN